MAALLVVLPVSRVGRRAASAQRLAVVGCGPAGPCGRRLRPARLEVHAHDNGADEQQEAEDVHGRDGLGEEEEGEADGEHLAAALDHLGHRRAVVLDQQEHEHDREVPHRGEHGGVNQHLGVESAVRKRLPQLARHQEQHERPAGAKQGQVQHHLRVRAVARAEETLLLKVRSQRVCEHSQGDQDQAAGVKGWRSGGIAHREDGDASCEHQCARVLGPRVPPSLDEHTHQHHRHHLARLEHHAHRVVDVLQRPVGEPHAGHGEHGHQRVVAHAAQPLRVACRPPLRRRARAVRECRQQRHVAAEPEAGDVKHLFLERGERHRTNERARRKNTKLDRL
mmetsp:Transcript_13082/g.45760  ORF Transcript_13082/g.45760 Transcript_13082/m.45760 type:complete len:337 (+) Transcript_13082:43-1053(+)